MLDKIKSFFSFINEGIWKVTEGEVTQRKFSLYNQIKT